MWQSYLRECKKARISWMRMCGTGREGIDGKRLPRYRLPSHMGRSTATAAATIIGCWFVVVTWLLEEVDDMAVFKNELECASGVKIAI
jgi:hypothetical protein